MPKVSVIMPLYNAEKYVQKAIDSILKQTFTDFELILINDCSIDKTMDVVSKIKDTRIRILENERNSGIAYSRNVGLENSNGQYIALMDDDDIATCERFEKEVAFLDTNKDIDVVGGRYCMIDENDVVIKKMGEPLVNPYYIKAYLMFYDPIGNGSTMFRERMIKEHDIRYQNNCFGMEDFRFWIDCSLHGKIVNLDDVFLHWRCWENETNKVFEKKKTEREKCFASLQRYAIEQNGYELNDKEFEILSKAFPEDMAKVGISIQALKELYLIFQKIIHQAEQKGIENKKEIKILCRKLFSRRLEISEVWN